MENTTWTTLEGKTLIKRDMTTKHILNCIRMLKRKMVDAEEEDEVLVADHWSLGGLCIIPGRETMKEQIKDFEEVLKERRKREIAHV